MMNDYPGEDQMDNTDMGAGGSPAEGGKGAPKNSFHIASDMLPGGMAETLKPGQCVEFQVVAPVDKDGDVELDYYGRNNHGIGDDEEAETTPDNEAAEGENENSGQGQSWENGLRSALSPNSPENE